MEQTMTTAGDTANIEVIPPTLQRRAEDLLMLLDEVQWKLFGLRRSTSDGLAPDVTPIEESVRLALNIAQDLNKAL